MDTSKNRKCTEHEWKFARACIAVGVVVVSIYGINCVRLEHASQDAESRGGVVLYDARVGWPLVYISNTPYIRSMVFVPESVKVSTTPRERRSGALPQSTFIFSGLQSLDISGYDVPDADLKRLIDRNRLKALDLTNCTLSNAAADIIKASPTLQLVAMDGTRLGDEQLADIAKMPMLRRFFADNTMAGVEVCKSVASSNSLEQVSLARTKIQDADCTLLASGRRLQIVDISHTNITCKGAGALLSSSSVKLLYVEGCDLEEDCISKLQLKLDGGLKY